MKTLFIEAKYEGKLDLKKIPIDKLPDKIGLISSVQFVDYLKTIKYYLEKKNKKIFLEKGKQKYKGQILGCDVSAAKKIEKKSDAFLYIGDGRFHPLGIALKTDKKVYCFNPIDNIFSETKKEEIEKIKKKIKENY